MTDPFRSHRLDPGAVEGHVENDEFLMALRYGDLKEIARNWATFTSDAPFRVPIPSEQGVRSVRQLPIECDPPAHTAYRQVISEVFSRRRAQIIRAGVEEVVDGLLTALLGRGQVDVVRQFALPVQSHALAALLGRSPGEAELWTSWGTHVFRDFSDSDSGHSSDLDRYLDSALDAALEARDAAQPDGACLDFFTVLAQAAIDGRPLDRDEMMGFANLVFAGGRDTVIAVIVDSLHYLATTDGALGQLRESPGLRATAVEEFLRHSSPITHIGRLVTEPVELCGASLEPGALVSLCFASANRDEEVFHDPDRIVLDRHPNRHVAFGHGPHTCIGAPHARMVLDVVLAAITTRVGSLSVVDADRRVEDLGSVERRATFDSLVLQLSAAVD